MDRPAYPTPVQGMYISKARMAARQEEKSRQKKTGSIIIVACIAIAVAAVLMISFYIGRSASAQVAEGNSVQTDAMNAVSCESMQEAADILGYIPAIPSVQAEDYVLVEVSVIEGNVLEMNYSNGKQSILYRTAAGSDDLSWDNTEYAFTTTEKVNGLNRTYAGVAEQKLSMAVWANGANSYALVASGGVDSEVLHTMAENVE